VRIGIGIVIVEVGGWEVRVVEVDRGIEIEGIRVEEGEWEVDGVW